MLIGLCGPACAGKRTVAAFLASELGFTCVPTAAPMSARSQELPSTSPGVSPTAHATDFSRPVPSQALMSQCWRRDINVVIECIGPGDPFLSDLLKRPYFLLVFVTAPMLTRFKRAVASGVCQSDDLLAFVAGHDRQMYGASPDDDEMSDSGADESAWTLADMDRRSGLRITNNSPGVDRLFERLRGLDMTNSERLRPGWDTYFMSLAKLAADRTNCMKRRVGCVIAKNRRIVSTGYNGTPSRVRNCLDGGCARCNGSSSKQGVGLDLCLCLHAEENAIIEAGRERCEGATLYTNLFPCILCAKVRCAPAMAGLVCYLPTFAAAFV
jgi:dCMP deaminase